MLQNYSNGDTKVPYEVKKEGDEYVVVNKDTGETKAHHATKEEAEAQVRLLEGIEHGMTPHA